MAADAQTGVGSGGTKAVPKPLWLLLVLLICTDLLVLRTAPGLGFVGLNIILAAAAHWVQRDKVKGRRAAVAWAILIVAVLPAIDVFQFISFASASAGRDDLCDLCASRGLSVDGHCAAGWWVRLGGATMA